MEPFVPHSHIFFFNHALLRYFLIKKEHAHFIIIPFYIH